VVLSREYGFGGHYMAYGMAILLETKKAVLLEFMALYSSPLSLILAINL
jgi:hypothetical protein